MTDRTPRTYQAKNQDSWKNISPRTIHEHLTALPSYRGLHWRRQVRLCLLLWRTRLLFDYQDASYHAVKNTVVAAKIGDVLKSLGRIADFNRDADKDPTAASAMLDIMSMGEVWAKHYADQLPISFRPSVMPGGQIDYGSAEVIASFFAAAKTIHKIAVEAQRSLLTEDQPLEDSAVTWVAGMHLPNLYTQFFGKYKPGYVVVRQSGSLGHSIETPSHGVEFVRLALKALNIRDDMKPETIRTHYKQARRLVRA